MSEFAEDVRKPNETVQVGEKLDKTVSSIDMEVEEWVAKFIDINDDAKQNDKKEKHMPLGEGLKTFPRAAMWSIILSTALVMEGYDKNLLASLYAMPAFQERFGEAVDPEDPNTSYEVASNMQTTLSMCANVGEILGLAIAGLIADKVGFRWTMICSLALVVCFVSLTFFAQNIGMLIAGQLLLGFPWGAFQTLTVSYASEVCPTVLRVYLTTYANVCWVFGQLISSGVLRSYVDDSSSMAYKVPFALQWMWPVPIAIGIFLAPESPWWLVRKGKLAEAKHSLKRLLTENKHLPNKELLAETMVTKMQITITEERLETNSGSSYLDCFKGKDFRRTRVACLTWLVQNITGSALMGYSTYFYRQAGLSTSMSFTFSIIQYVLGIIGTFGSWFLSMRFGRFDIFFSGLVINTCILLIVGGLAFSSNPDASWGIGSLILVFTFVYDISVGPITYCLVAELPSAKLRTKTIILARNTYNIAGVVIAIITPQMLNPTAWNWGAKTGLFWAGFSFFSAIWCWFELPETKGKTFAELDVLFRDGTSARKFKKAEVDVFDANELIEKMGKDGIKSLVVNNEQLDKEKSMA